MENQEIYLPNQSQGVNVENFLLLTVIGKGSYGKVVLVKKIDSGEIFAMKILKKKYIEKRKQEDHVQTERNVLVETKHTFIVKLSYSFQNERKLFFVMEYCPGGELFNLLSKRKRFTEDQVLFYSSQILLAMESLHKQNIIYRDLKPENVLIDQFGYIKLTDFGLSKMNVITNKDAKSICGTPEYLAPEVIFKLGHGKAVDWWTFGCIIFEMLTGLPPFYTQNRTELFENIKFGNLKYPSYLSPLIKSLLDGLFQKEPEKRLGGGPGGAQEIKNHPWFCMVNWNALLNREIKPPFVPILKSELDVSNFDPEFTETQIDSMSEGNSLRNQSVSDNYKGFTYNDDMVKSQNQNGMDLE